MLSDEEKAEEILQTKGSMTFCAKGCGYTEKVKELIAIGLAEGRKEGYEQGKNNERESQCGKKNYEKDITRLKKENAELSNSVTELTNTKTELKTKVTELEKQIEKMKSFIHSEIDFCVYCPLTDECVNDEGACPYAYSTEEEQKNLLMDFINKWESVDE
ncbi:MAG: hypothetical protein MJZ37_00325 [Bacilli bacterium]|nr:hypothetical protein [Bacilli bacterium]